ncbi:VOC family protein [Novosphingobium sp. PS1R-30]|uniref:VOC family protein n=1 Tax=Novosphingobium anseongense TaxID=3133436 RepID=A0ABU8S3S0_9SPHN
MLRKVAFTMYPVTDMAAARAFYEGPLGLLTASSPTTPWVEYDLPGGGCFAITTVLSDAPSASAGGTIAFEVEDIEALVARLRSSGVRLAGEALIKGPHCWMMTCFDPDGNSVLLHQLDHDHVN